jgi:hypothetical protein
VGAFCAESSDISFSGEQRTGLPNAALARAPLIRISSA